MLPAYLDQWSCSCHNFATSSTTSSKCNLLNIYLLAITVGYLDNQEMPQLPNFDTTKPEMSLHK